MRIFKHLEVGGTSAKVDAHQGRNRAVGIVRQYPYVIGFRHGGDFTTLIEAAAMTQVGLDIVGRLRFQQLAKHPAGV